MSSYCTLASTMRPPASSSRWAGHQWLRHAAMLAYVQISTVTLGKTAPNMLTELCTTALASSLLLVPCWFPAAGSLLLAPCCCLGWFPAAACIKPSSRTASIQATVCCRVNIWEGLLVAEAWRVNLSDSNAVLPRLSPGLAPAR